MRIALELTGRPLRYVTSWPGICFRRPGLNFATSKLGPSLLSLTLDYPSTMVPNLALSQHDLIQSIVESKLQYVQGEVAPAE